MKKSNLPSLAVGVLVKDYQGRIFLGKSPKWQGKWIVPGGHLENEPLEQCALREVKEELGVNVKNLKFLQIQEAKHPKDYINPKKHFVFINFLADITRQEKFSIKLNEEFEEYCFIDPKEALKKLKLNTSTKRLLISYLRYKRYIEN